MSTIIDQANPLVTKFGMASTRTIDADANAGLGTDWHIVSADNHCEVTEDIFYENFPTGLKDRAPRVWFDRCWRMGVEGRVAFGADVDRSAHIFESVHAVDGFDNDLRLKRMAAEGISQEIVFPQSLLGLLSIKDPVVRELVFSIYNDYVADLGRGSNGKSFYIPVLPNWWDETKVESCVRKIVDAGFKAFMIPLSLKDREGNVMSLAAPELDRLWSLIEEVQIPLNFHIGEDPTFGGPGGIRAGFMRDAFPFRWPLGQLIFGGVFDRHPRLKVVFSEGGINWVASFLHDAEMGHDIFKGVDEVKLLHRPTHYWQQHCYASFQNDSLGLKLIDYIGTDRVMWANDYPHSEGSFGYSKHSMDAVRDAVSESDARKILGETARSVYNLP